VEWDEPSFRCWETASIHRSSSADEQSLVAGGSAVGDIQTAWSADAGDLIEIAITSQRIAQTRGLGLDLFETLMDLSAYEASQVLRELDRRPV
jgi:hypothetical protein